MRLKSVLCLRYVLQVTSLGFFVFLFTALFYPLGWETELLQWFSRLDPWFLFSHIRWQHSLPTWAWLPLMTLITTLLLGRVFCGWLCPFGALLMLVDKVSRAISKKRSLKTIALTRTKILHRAQPVRYYWLLFVVTIFVLGSNWVIFLTPFTLFSHEIVRILQGTVPWVLMGVILITLFFSRIWCSVLCPTGVLLSLIGRLRLFRYQVAGRCVNCAKCTQNCSVGAAPVHTGVAKEGCLACGECSRVCPTKAVSWQSSSCGRQKSASEIVSGTVEEKKMYSRRQFFLKSVFMVSVAAALWKKPVRAANKVLRPPGALDEADFTAVCNRCARCMKICPNKALQPMPITEGILRFETPYIIPREASCILCLSCQEVCPTGAIEQMPVERVHMGRAEIDKLRCIAWNENKLCDICGEQCPIQAIESDGQHRPTVLLSKCVGCGSCEKGCPVDGEAAIRVIPK